jgi:hypothetical protein
MLTHEGEFTVYFNKHIDAPRTWCIAARDRSWEINVVSIELRAPVTTVYDPQPHVADHHGPPSAYFVGRGLVQVDDEGRAIIRGDAMSRELALRIVTSTKHGPGGMGGPGPCDRACLKCEADRELEREMTRGRR